jgi:hypothetical protein
MKSKIVSRFLVAGALAGALAATSATHLSTAHAAYDDYTDYEGAVDDVDDVDDAEAIGLLAKLAKTKRLRRLVRDAAVVVATEVADAIGVALASDAPDMDGDQVDGLFDLTNAK